MYHVPCRIPAESFIFPLLPSFAHVRSAYFAFSSLEQRRLSSTTLNLPQPTVDQPKTLQPAMH